MSNNKNNNGHSIMGLGRVASGRYNVAGTIFSSYVSSINNLPALVVSPSDHSLLAGVMVLSGLTITFYERKSLDSVVALS